MDNYVHFIGSVRSGHTLVAQIINSHPDAVISDELDVLGNLNRYKNKEELFRDILRKDKKWVGDGAKSFGYRYKIGYWQGRIRDLKVIGDKHAGPNTTLIGKDDKLLDKFMDFIGLPFKFIYIKRNKDEQVESMYRMRSRRVVVHKDDIRRYWEMQQDVALKIYIKYGGLIIKIEDLKKNKREEIVKVLNYLNLEVINEHIKICERFVI